MENKSNSGVVYQGKIPGRVKYCFAFGALGKDLIYGMIATFSMIYFTDIIKVAPAFIGTMFFVAKLWDAFNDLFMGMIVDNTRSRWGKFVPWLVIGTLINSFVFVTVFTDFHLSGVSLCVFASVVYVLWGMTYTIMDIPYWSIIPNLTSDPEEREKVSVLPRIFASIGQSLIIAGFGVQIIKGLGGNYIGYHRFALIIAATFIFTMAVCVINLPKKQQDTGTTEKMKFRDIFTVIKKNDQLRWAVLLILLYNVGIQAIMGVATYYFSYVCNNAGMLSAFMISASVAEVVGLLIFPEVTKLLSRKKAFLLACTLPPVGLILLLVVGFVCPSNIPLTAIAGIIVKTGTGLELSKIIHDNYINTKIILFSGWDDFEYARTAISYGVSQYLMKPIDYNEMQKLLTNIHEELEKEYAEKLNRTRLENIYAESIPLLRQQFLTQLLTEPVTDEYYDSQIKNLKLNLNYTVFHIITVKIRTTDLIDVLSELSIKETIKEALEKISSLYEFGIIDKEVFLLCGNKKHDIERITRTIQEASVLIERIFHTRISCGISSSTTTIKELPLLYQQALEALDYNVVIQEESYTYYNDILPLQKKEEDWNSEVDSIEKIITRCSEEELKQAVITMLEHLHSSHYNLSEYQIVVLEISFSLSRLYKKYQLTSDKEFAGSKKMAVKILSLNTGEELDNWLINYFQLIRTLIQKKQVDNNVILAENAKKLVEERFQEPDLSVESICQELHVSSSYFSKIFKQETGSTFLNYLINRRMEAAKMLLDVTDYKSHVIGTMVGYPEPNYFSYVFKKHCGISPVKYRKLGGSVNEK